jgi:hypothetical protein
LIAPINELLLALWNCSHGSFFAARVQNNSLIGQIKTTQLVRMRNIAGFQNVPPQLLLPCCSRSGESDQESIFDETFSFELSSFSPAVDRCVYIVVICVILKQSINRGNIDLTASAPGEQATVRDFIKTIDSGNCLWQRVVL